MSDPWRSAQFALAEPQFQLAAVVVDAAALAQHAADPLLADTLARPLAHADLVPLTSLRVLASPSPTQPDDPRVKPAVIAFGPAGQLPVRAVAAGLQACAVDNSNWPRNAGLTQV